MGLSTLFQWLIDQFNNLTPVYWVFPGNEAVRMFGRRYKKVGPGFHFKLPWAMRFKPINVKRQTVDAPDQIVEDSTGTPWLVSLSVTYFIRNVVKALIETQDFDISLITDTMNIVADWVNANGNITIVRIRDNCETQVKRAGSRWGCEVERLEVNSLSRAKPLYIRGLG